ncbi:hypothetical protein HPB49_004510 [Dermacentor silvarum]|uniref:Uncharacterized protein n=1 Tax=Dermacentor silvarum TaxID=543639 RepID=A0ACB8CPR6_DERSI|nr:hypothetical protein HPB49_004510 [Dermacentor silvarum]
MAETRMEDEDATGLEENEEDLGWQIVTSRKSRSTRRISGDGKTTPQSQQEQGNNSKNKGPTTTTFKNRIVKASRMPQLPQEHSKIVIRPRGGLNLSKVSTTAIGVAVIEASGLTPEQAREDVVCPNFTQNIVVVSTPDPSHAARSASRATSAERQWDAQTGVKERSRSKSPTRSRRRSPSKGRSRSRSREVQVRFEGGKQKPGDKTTSGTAWADKVKGTVRAAESGAGQQVGDNDARIEQLIKEVTYLRKANEELTKQVVELRKNSQSSSTKVAIAKPVNNDNNQEEENSPAPKKRAISPVETTVCSALEEIKEAIKQLRDATDRTTFKVDKLWKWRVTTEKRLSKVEAQGEDDEYLPSEAESVRSLPGPIRDDNRPSKFNRVIPDESDFSKDFCRGLKDYQKRAHLHLYIETLQFLVAVVAPQEPGAGVKLTNYTTFQHNPQTASEAVAPLGDNASTDEAAMDAEETPAKRRLNEAGKTSQDTRLRAMERRENVPGTKKPRVASQQRVRAMLDLTEFTGLVIWPLHFNVIIVGMTHQLQHIEGVHHAIYADDITV